MAMIIDDRVHPSILEGAYHEMWCQEFDNGPFVPMDITWSGEIEFVNDSEVDAAFVLYQKFRDEMIERARNGIKPRMPLVGSAGMVCDLEVSQMKKRVYHQAVMAA